MLQPDGLNAQVEARMAGVLTRWRKYGGVRREAIKAQLERILAKPGLGDNVLEIGKKSLDG